MAIEDAGGVEVFFIGKVDDNGCVVSVLEHARGTETEVLALFDRGKPGDVVIHNHPSGHLQPSNADFNIAGRVGAAGMGFYIVDNQAANVNPVVRPWRGQDLIHLDPEFASRLLDDGGKLSDVVDGYRHRKSQVRMSEAVCRSLNQGGLRVVEAGTGIGKSFAYLGPAARFAIDNGTPVVVSTGTIALQEQLFDKDIPAIAKATDGALRAIKLKGRGNYVSIRRARAYLDQGLVGEGREVQNTVEQWLDRTPDGDRSTLPENVPGDTWEEIQSESDNCLRARCPSFQQCFYFKSRRTAATAHLVVVNHALLSADLRVRREAGIGMSETILLPPYDHVIVDEAHSLEGYARNQFGARTSETGIQRALGQLYSRRRNRGSLVRLKSKLIDQAAVLPRHIQDEVFGRLDKMTPDVEQLRNAVAEWFASCNEWLGSRERSLPERMPGNGDGFAEIRDSGVRLAEFMEDFSRRLLTVISSAFVEELPPVVYAIWSEVQSRAERLERHAAVIRAVLTNKSDREVAWLDRQGRARRIVLEIAPVDVGELLRQSAWTRLRGVVLTSATLTTGPDDFRFLARNTGLDGQIAEQLQLGSPFDYQRNVRLNVITDRKGPARGDWNDDDIDLVADLIRSSSGRALVLCTSFSVTNRLSDGLGRRSDFDFRVFRQGQLPPVQLARRFREDTESVLVGTASFWEGFDAAGDALRHVIITRLPFSVPTHPLEVARHDWVKSNGGNPFKDVSLPDAITRFRQGFGRLIRTETDWGAVSILDDRIRSKGYGKKFLDALPPTDILDAPAATAVAETARWFAAMQDQSLSA